MALSQSVASELLEAFRAGEGVDLIRESVRLVMQELIETVASERIGAGRYERTEARVTDRNGSRPRLVATQGGDVELWIPKLRRGSFFPAILEPRRRIDQALYAVVMEAYVNGVSTRAVDDLVAALGIESGISKSEVSRICAGLDEQVEAFRSRPLHHIGFRYVFLDATYLHVRRSGQVTSMAVVVATGVTAVGGGGPRLRCRRFGGRGVLARLPAHVETARLSGVRLVIFDQHAGLVAALGRVFQGVGHQRCRVHFARNLLALVPKSHKDMVVPHHLRPTRPRHRSARLHHLPPQPLGEDLVDQSAAEGQQGDQTPRPSGGDLPQRASRDPPRRRRLGRHARRVASLRPPLPLRRLNGQDQHDR